jgi:hypothetical protein
MQSLDVDCTDSLFLLIVFLAAQMSTWQTMRTLHIKMLEASSYILVQLFKNNQSCNSKVKRTASLLPAAHFRLLNGVQVGLILISSIHFNDAMPIP